MEITVPVVYTTISVLLALAVGYIIALVSTDNRHRKITRLHERRLREEYSGYRRDVSEHVSESARRIRQVTDQYRILYLQLAGDARLSGLASSIPPAERGESETADVGANSNNSADFSSLDLALVELRDDLLHLTTQLQIHQNQAATNTPGATAASDQKYRELPAMHKRESRQAPAATSSCVADTAGSDPSPPTADRKAKTAAAVSSHNKESKSVQWRRLVDDLQPGGSELAST